MRFTFYCIHYAAPIWWQQQAFIRRAPKSQHTSTHTQTKENFRFQSRNFIQLSKNSNSNIIIFRFYDSSAGLA